MLNPNDWARLEALFHDACALPVAERTEFAHAQVGDHPELLRELLTMLEAESAATEAVRKPLRGLGAHLSMDIETLPAGTRFGPWEVESLIGKGGMGQVYLGRRADGAYDMKVAIKVIGTRGEDRQRRDYFEFERQMLAHMQHPAIAQILDAGSDEQDRLYLVMEYVRGQSLTRWCAQHTLSLRERVMLLIRVAEGVQHAHQKGVIHRDLKPGNILISDADGSGEPAPKIIDFGIAARTGNDTERQLPAAGTPGYMSPEQITASLDIDSRSDVYSLGAILFELVSGKRPRGSRNTGESSSEPLCPSDEIDTLSPEEMSDLAARLRTPPQHLRRMLRHDLDWIVARATQPDRNLRYPSAASFADDLKRWLDGYPPQAAPHRRLRAMRKFVRRNRLAVAACAALCVAVLGGLAATSWSLHRAEQAIIGEQAANRFLSDVLTSVDPSVSFDLDQTLMRRVLDNASQRIKTDLAGQPLARITIETTLAHTYSNLGDVRHAIAHLESARETAIAASAANSLPAQLAIMELAEQLTHTGQLARAESLLRDNLPVALRLSAADPVLAPRMESRLGWNLRMQGRRDEALPLLQHAYETLLQRVGPEHQRTIDAKQYYAIGLADAKRLPEAIAMMKSLIEQQTSRQGAEHPKTLALRNSLANFHGENDDLASAEAEFRGMIDVIENQHGTSHRMLPILHVNLATTLNQSGVPEKIAEAGPLFRAALNAQLESAGPDAPNTITMRRLHAYWLANAGPADAARDELQITLDATRKVLGDVHPTIPDLLTKLSRQELALGNLAAARSHAEDALARIRAASGDDKAGDEEAQNTKRAEIESLLADIQAAESTP